MPELDSVGRDWVISEVGDMTDTIRRMTPVEYNEATRYLPESVTSIPGYIRYDVNPWMREIVNCGGPDSPVREVNIRKGVQTTYTVAVLEAMILYYAAHIKTLPMMLMTAEKELADIRIENNILPMFQQSDLSHIIQSNDEGNTRKTGKNANGLQFQGGAYLLPFGAKNLNKVSSFSICIMLKDEIDKWPESVGKGGDPDKLSDGRCSAYWARRKIFRGSTPLIRGISKIQKAYKRGDQRKYLVLCKSCGFPQELRWSSVNKENGIIGGFNWEMEEGTLIHESVSYDCYNCGHSHYEHDKRTLFSEAHGAHWNPTARPVEPDIRSYHLPAFYSPIGMQPWYKSVGSYLAGFDPVTKKVTDIDAYQVFYNETLALPFEVMGSKVSFMQVSAHRRSVYRLGEIPNKYAAKYSGSEILFLTCQVDVHKDFLALSVMGWCRDLRCYVIESLRFESDGKIDCDDSDSKVWGELRELIEEKVYTADNGIKYRLTLTLIDAGWANATVLTFCSDYASGVIPILGRDRPGKNQQIKEFKEFTSNDGTKGYMINVDHYKDRIAPVLRREWVVEAGSQKPYHFNAPVDITDKHLKELTVEKKRSKIDDKGNKVFYWYRPGNARNELWDLLVYGHAAVEILAWSICIGQFELETVDWVKFWDYIESEKLYIEK